MGINHSKEEARCVGVGISDEPSVPHISHDMLDRDKGYVYVRAVVHSKKDSRNNLDDQTYSEEASKVSEVTQR